MENTKISWATHTFNPWRGCAKVSPGCDNCYAETMSHRNPKVLGVWGKDGTRVVASESQWKQPLKWDREAAVAGERRRVFCASLGDVFEDWRHGFIDSQGRSLYIDIASRFGPGAGPASRHASMSDVRTRLFNLIDQTPNLDWLLLTKRPENIINMMPSTCNFCSGFMRLKDTDRCECGGYESRKPRPNVWIGTSVENQEMADERIPYLLRVPARVRFLSIEPLLGPVDFRLTKIIEGFEQTTDSLNGVVSFDGQIHAPIPKIDWVILGGESGGKAREARIEWYRDIIAQCREAGVPVFMKQVGSNPTESVDDGVAVRSWQNAEIYVRENRVALQLADSKGGDPDEWPEDIRVQEFPEQSC